MSERGDNTERFGDELARLNARLADLARRNLLSEAVQAEYLYRDLLNRLYGWDLVDANEGRSNFEAVDLVDRRAKVAVQVSVTRDEGKVRKVNETLAKPIMGRYAQEGYHVIFCFIGEQGDAVKASKAIRNPHNVRFDQGADVLHTADLLAAFTALGPRGQREALHVVDGAGHEDFYEWVCDKFFGDTGGELYGDVPLSECYIEPTVDAEGKDGSWMSVREWVESFVAGDEAVAVLCGEPGHGKTSLCRKAVADFYKSGWLAGRVPNVFCFSLNPANTDALDHASFDFHSLLSWGNDRRGASRRIAEEHCRGALVLLDAFDELLEWHPAFDLAGFVRDHVIPFQRETGARVVITTRGMVVDSHVRSLLISRRTVVPIVRLMSIIREQQLRWIGAYAQHLRAELKDDSDSPASGRRAGLEEELDQLEAYAKRFGELDEDADFQKVLGVPIIFRMVAAARYLPRKGESITRIYDDLFDITWERHDHGDDDPSDPREVARARLSRHALRVYADDADTAVVSDVSKTPWTFAFYTTHTSEGGKRGRSRVGFLHRSFYQHFLAHEVLSWLERYATDEDDENTFRDNLSYLARRRLDETTLGYIRDMYEDMEDKESFDSAFDKAYAILKETDGILPLPKDERDVAQIKAVTPLGRRTTSSGMSSPCAACVVMR